MAEVKEQSIIVQIPKTCGAVVTKRMELDKVSLPLSICKLLGNCLLHPYIFFLLYKQNILEKLSFTVYDKISYNVCMYELINSEADQ